MPLAFIHCVFWLFVGHALCDFPLQTQGMSRGKRPHFPEGANGFWIVATTAHALIHAGAVAAVTGSVELGLLELWLHWSLDYRKARGHLSAPADQASHIACKLLWAHVAVFTIHSFPNGVFR